MKKQHLIIVGIIAFVLALAVGFAIFSEQLTITGNATASGNLNVEFTSIGKPTCTGFSGTCDVETLTEISDAKDTLTVSVNKLDYPGAYVEIPVTITNTGTIDIKSVTFEEEGLVNGAIEVTYQKMPVGTILKVGESITRTVKVEWDSNIDEGISDARFTIRVNGQQAK